MKLESLFCRFFIIAFLICPIFSNTSVAQQQVFSQWNFESQRKEIAPVSFIDKKVLFNNAPTLALLGGGKKYADGHWYNVANVQAGKYYAFEASFMTSKVEEPDRSVLARIIWQNESGQTVGEAEYPATLLNKNKQGWSVIKQTYKVPDNASKAKLELQYRWDADGAVHFGGISFEPTNPLPARMVNLASIHFRPVDSKSSQENLEKF